MEVDPISFGLSAQATVLRNSAAGGVAFVALTKRWMLAPLNPAVSKAEFVFELEDLPAHAALLDELVAQPWAGAACAARAVPVFRFRPDAATVGLFSIDAPVDVRPNPWANDAAPETVALLLHTSGTTSKPKLAPPPRGTRSDDVRFVSARRRNDGRVRLSASERGAFLVSAELSRPRPRRRPSLGRLSAFLPL